jgi:NACHT domain
MADVFLVLGAAVAKAAFRIWFRDEELPSAASDSLTDWIRDRLSDIVDQRKVGRFFEDLEVPVAKRMRAICQAEFSRLPANEWNAAVRAAGISFDRVRLAPKDLFSRDLDPLALERYIRSDRARATRDLSVDGTGLYDRLVAEGCLFVIEIADQLPHFQAGAFTELLRRDRQILGAIFEVLERLSARGAAGQRDTRFETVCRNAIVRHLDHLELLGLEFESSSYPLSVAYVSLRTEEQVGSGRRAVEEWLAASPRIMLTGRAGSGKTTVLQWLAVRAAQSDFSGELAYLNDHFPFFIRLRKYVGRELPRPRAFLEDSAWIEAEEAPQDWIVDKLDSGQALVLVDGVDELPLDERGEVGRWIGELVERFPLARYVVTARPAAIAPNWLEDRDFTHSSIETMPEWLVQQFVRNWHEAARQQVPETAEREALDGYEQSMLVAISEDKYLGYLADTPLLAGLLCALNRHMRAKLPHRRSEIYEQALAMLDRRDRARHIEASAVELDRTAKDQLLSDLALWMTRRGASEVDVGSATGLVGRSMGRLPGIAARQEDVFSVLLERSGLLRDPVVDRVGFVHRTFQEYLAAKAVVDGDVVPELFDHADDAQWGEIIVFAAGQANQEQARELLQGLLGRTWRARQRSRRRVLAVACLREVRSLGQPLKKEVESVVSSLLPPQSMEQAEQLSAAGQMLIPLLARHWSRVPSRGPETIRAASLVGGPAAMELIRDVALGGRLSDLVDEVARAWQYFEPADYARTVLGPAGITSMRVGGMRFLRALTEMASLEELRLETAAPVDFGVVAKIPHLKKLSLLRGVPPTDLSPLARCADLRKLTIFGYWRHNLLDIPYVPGLTELGVASDAALSLAGIAKQRDLTELSVFGCVKLTDLAGLGSLTELDTVYLSDVRELDLASLALPPTGLLLYLDQCGDVDLAPLAGRNELTIRYKTTRLLNKDSLGDGPQLQQL